MAVDDGFCANGYKILRSEPFPPSLSAASSRTMNFVHDAKSCTDPTPSDQSDADEIHTKKDCRMSRGLRTPTPAPAPSHWSPQDDISPVEMEEHGKALHNVASQISKPANVQPLDVQDCSIISPRTHRPDHTRTTTGSSSSKRLHEVFDHFCATLPLTLVPSLA